PSSQPAFAVAPVGPGSSAEVPTFGVASVASDGEVQRSSDISLLTFILAWALGPPEIQGAETRYKGYAERLVNVYGSAHRFVSCLVHFDLVNLKLTQLGKEAGIYRPDDYAMLIRFVAQLGNRAADQQFQLALMDQATQLSWILRQAALARLHNMFPSYPMEVMIKEVESPPATVRFDIKVSSVQGETPISDAIAQQIRRQLLFWNIELLNIQEGCIKLTCSCSLPAFLRVIAQLSCGEFLGRKVLSNPRILGIDPRIEKLPFAVDVLNERELDDGEVGDFAFEMAFNKLRGLLSLLYLVPALFLVFNEWLPLPFAVCPMEGLQNQCMLSDSITPIIVAYITLYWLFELVCISASRRRLRRRKLLKWLYHTMGIYVVCLLWPTYPRDYLLFILPDVSTACFYLFPRTQIAAARNCTFIFRRYRLTRTQSRVVSDAHSVIGPAGVCGCTRRSSLLSRPYHTGV
ncbi:MAG: hypothetical protein SGPRY_010551, partial [Prymnesium sp.]